MSVSDERQGGKWNSVRTWEDAIIEKSIKEGLSEELVFLQRHEWNSERFWKYGKEFHAERIAREPWGG